MRKYFYFMIVLILSGGAFISCLDNEEPKGIENLRGAMSELYKAHAQVQLAEAELKKAELAMMAARVEEQKIVNQLQEVKVEREKAALEADKIANEMLKIRNQYAENDLELAKLRAEAYLDYEKTVWAIELEGRQATLDKQLSDLEVTKKENEKQISKKENAMKLAAENHKAAMISAQEVLAKAELAYQQALKEIEAAKITLTGAQQEQLDAITAELKKARIRLATKQKKLIEKERKLVGLNITFDPVSYGKNLAFNVETEKLAVDLQKDLKEKVSVFNKKPFAEWEKQLTEVEDTISAIKVIKEDIEMQIAKINTDEIQPLNEQINTLEKVDLQKKNDEKAELQEQQTKVREKLNKTDKKFDLAIPGNHKIDKYLYEIFLRSPYPNYIINDYNQETEVFAGDVLRFHNDISLETMHQLLIGNNMGFNGIIKDLLNKILTPEKIAQEKDKCDMWKRTRDAAKEAYDAKISDFQGLVEKYQTARDAYWISKDRSLMDNVKDAYKTHITDIEDAGNIPAKANYTALLAVVKPYVTSRIALDGQGPIPETITLADATEKTFGNLTADDFVSSPEQVKLAIKLAISNEVSKDYPSGGAFQAWGDASVELFGTQSYSTAYRLTELKADEFKGKLNFSSWETIVYSNELRTILNDLNIDYDEYDPNNSFETSLWLLNYKATAMYNRINDKISNQTEWNAIVVSARTLLTDVTAQITAIKDEVSTFDLLITAVETAIGDIRKQIADLRKESDNIELEKISPLEIQQENLNQRVNALKDLNATIQRIMGASEDGTIDQGWMNGKSAEEIKEKINIGIRKYEQAIIDAETELANAQKKLDAFNEGLISDSPEDIQRRQIADCEKEIAVLKTEIEKSQKEFEELTARKDHLMEIFLGSNK